jgi:transposase
LVTPRPYQIPVSSSKFQCFLGTCCAHLARDLEDAAQTYPDAHWPVHILEALQGLIHAANQARASGLAAVPADIAGPLIKAFRHGVIPGLGQVRRVDARKQLPYLDLLECLRNRQDDVLRFVSDLRVPWPRCWPTGALSWWRL